MKSAIRVFIGLIFAGVFSVNALAQNTVMNTVANFNITENGTKFNFDIYTLRTSAGDFIMGNSSYFLRYTAGTFSNPVLTYINPKYTSGSVTNSYDQMRPFGYSSGRVAVQLYYNSNGPGDIISSELGSLGYGEKIASVSMDIVSLNLPDFRWDNLNTAVVNPQNITATSTNVGYYNGTLPVELSAFSASVSGNSVTLNWATSFEESNSGFEIERSAGDGQFSKIGFVAGNGNTSSPRSYSFSDRNLNTGSYTYRLRQIDYNGNFSYFDLQGGVEVGIPGDFVLHQNYPNPFNPSTTINFDLPYAARVTLSVYDMSGRLVATAISNESRPAGYYSVSFNASSLSSGVYFYELRTDMEVRSRKFTLVK